MPKYHWTTNDYKQSGYDDMVLLPKLNEQSIYDNLKKRFLDNYIYTYIGPVLISVNPYKEMPYFTQNEIEIYKGATQIENPPHIYALSDNMYRNMLIDNESQCVIISGESGAGKTQSAKYIMNYVSKISGGNSSEKIKHIKDIILQSNPILESFGNAKTLRNNNSSRFGKYVEIEFSLGGEPVGGKITNFLLEKSRVVSQISNERNFHIFYQLCNSNDESFKKSLGIQKISLFNYLNKCDESVDGIDDLNDFKQLLIAFNTIKLNDLQQESIFKLLAGILHIGNVCFNESNNYAILKHDTALEYPCYLFGINKELLKLKLTSRVIEARGEKINSKFNVQQAEFARDALAKAIYSRLFDYLVEAINRAMQNDTKKINIGILDIYGFEVFKLNGFEQFCINYVNEKLQQIFIELTLKAEQEEYHQEGIKWNEIEFFNNKIVCDLIEAKQPQPGIFCILDDVCATIHADVDNSDSHLLQKLRNNFNNKHLHFSSNNSGFIVRHYAGDVDYVIEGFCEKNRDTLFNDLIELMKSSDNNLLKSLFISENASTTNNNNNNSRRPTTAGSKIKTQANLLVDTLMKCYPHYIRCIKPNDRKQPSEFNESLVKHQIKYLGLVENIKVRRAGFAYRREFNKFIQRYDIIIKSHSKNKDTLSSSLINNIKLIMSKSNIDENEWQLGKTKIFIKSPESLFQLEEIRDRRYNEYAVILQKAFRKYNSQKYFINLKMDAYNLIKNNKERRDLSLNRNYYGDYIGLDARPSLKALIPTKRETIEFTQKCFKYDRSFKRTCRDLILTNRCIYIIGREIIKDKINKTKKIIECIKRKIEFNSLDRIVLSKLKDNFIILFPSQNEYSTVLEIEFKIEFITILNKNYKKQFNKQLNMEFVDSIEYKIKKEGWRGGGTRCIKFNKINSNENNSNIKINGKTCTVSIGNGLTSINNKPQIDYYKNFNFKNEPWWPKFQQLCVKYDIKIKSLSSTELSSPKSKDNARQKEQIEPPKITNRSTKKPKLQLSDYPKYKALYDYIANESDELTFNEGDFIYIIQEGDSNSWWKGMLSNGKTGLIPSNYIEKLK